MIGGSIQNANIQSAGRTTIDEDDDLETEHVPIMSGKVIGGGPSKPAALPTKAPAGGSLGLGLGSKAVAPSKQVTTKPQRMSVEDYDIEHDEDRF
jgi:hypothetical protein